MKLFGVQSALTVLTASSLTSFSHGFTSPSTTSPLGQGLPQTTLSPRTLDTQLHVDAGTGWDNFCIENRDDAKYIAPEEARKFRRTVYTHDDWKKHRQQDRFFIYLGSLFDSGIYQNSKREVFVCTAIAAALCAYNAVVGGYTDFAGVEHAPLIAGQKIGIPMTAYTITSSSLGLLLSKCPF